MLEDQIADITFSIESAKTQVGEQYTVKQMEKTKKSLKAKLEKLNDQTRKDDVVTFEQLGVDRPQKGMKSITVPNWYDEGKVSTHISVVVNAP